MGRGGCDWDGDEGCASLGLFCGLREEVRKEGRKKERSLVGFYRGGCGVGISVTSR